MAVAAPKTQPQTITPGVTCVPLYLGGLLELANVFFIDVGAGKWVLVDTGIIGLAGTIRQAAAQRYGPDQPPEAIILTHAHFDHAGTVSQLASEWHVPVYAHTLELPYLTGKAKLPPLDPTVGGFMATLSHIFPPSGIDIGEHVRPLPADGSIAELPGWQWIHTPGHTPGHTSLFQQEHQALIAADALTTMNQEHLALALATTPQLNGPPTYATSDWVAARSSVALLADLNPATIASGHGIPISGPTVAQALHDLADHFDERAVPAHGRYIHQPARTDAAGIVALPPPERDPFWYVVAGATLGLAAVLGVASRRRQE